MAIADKVIAIRNAVYGRDVREALASGLEECYGDPTGDRALAEAAAEAAEQAAGNADSAKTAAEAAAGNADSAKTAAEAAARAAQLSVQQIDTHLENYIQSNRISGDDYRMDIGNIG